MATLNFLNQFGQAVVGVRGASIDKKTIENSFLPR